MSEEVSYWLNNTITLNAVGEYVHLKFMPDSFMKKAVCKGIVFLLVNLFCLFLWYFDKGSKVKELASTKLSKCPTLSFCI